MPRSSLVYFPCFVNIFVILVNTVCIAYFLKIPSMDIVILLVTLSFSLTPYTKSDALRRRSALCIVLLDCGLLVNQPNIKWIRRYLNHITTALEMVRKQELRMNVLFTWSKHIKAWEMLRNSSLKCLVKAFSLLLPSFLLAELVPDPYC